MNFGVKIYIKSGWYPNQMSDYNLPKEDAAPFNMLFSWLDSLRS
jgi:hypothetical protein